jgi:hypothetical protein
MFALSLEGIGKPLRPRNRATCSAVADQNEAHDLTASPMLLHQHNRGDELEDKEIENAKLRAVILLLLDCVDYTSGACGVTELVGAVLPQNVITQAREALKKQPCKDGEDGAAFAATGAFACGGKGGSGQAGRGGNGGHAVATGTGSIAIGGKGGDAS